MIELIVTKHDDGSITTKELIRCKDCENRGTSDCPIEDYNGDACFPWIPSDDWFCADGKSKEGETE